jgi:hypothetical protein
MSRENEPNGGDLEGWERLGAAWRNEPVGAPPPIDVAEVRRRADAFARTIRRRNLREIAAGAVVIAGGAGIAATAPARLGQLGGVAMVLGAIAVSLFIALRARNRPAPPPAAPTREVLAHERAELERQARLLERVWIWYLAPLLPSVVLIYADALIRALGRSGPERTVGIALSAGLFGASLAFFVLIGRLNARAAQRLRARMAQWPPPEDDLTGKT